MARLDSLHWILAGGLAGALFLYFQTKKRLMESQNREQQFRETAAQTQETVRAQREQNQALTASNEALQAERDRLQAQLQTTMQNAGMSSETEAEVLALFQQAIALPAPPSGEDEDAGGEEEASA